MTETIRIADWTFAPDTGVLENGADSTRLEHRTAALLSLLAERPGELVSHAEIIEQVWDDRAVSPNSVAVVISDIRRALGDDPRQPVFVETLPKRGYRLIADVQVDAPAPTLPPVTDPSAPHRGAARWVPPAIVVFLLALILGRNVLTPPNGATGLPVTVVAATNETGDAQYDPLTASVTELLSVQLAQHDTFALSTDNPADVIVTGKLILWDGHPSMSIYAESTRSGEIIWSGMASGPETLLPRQVRQEIAEFSQFTQDQVLAEQARDN